MSRRLSRRTAVLLVPLFAIAVAAAWQLRVAWLRGAFREPPADVSRPVWTATADRSRFEAEVGPEAARGLNAYEAWRFKNLQAAIEGSRTPFLGDKPLQLAAERVAALPAAADPLEVFTAKLHLADVKLVMGPAAASLSEYDECVAIARTRGDRQLLANALSKRAVAHLRVGERCNCVARNNSESCIFPLSPRAEHAEAGGSAAAARDLVELLEIAPEDDGAAWLLNLAHMTLGSWPQAVPERFRIPPEALQSEYDIGRFKNVAAELGVATFSRAGGAIMDDFDGDGALDLLTSSMDSGLGLHLFRNQGDRKFVDQAEQRGIAGHLGGLQIVHGDVNNDGRLDVLVLRGAWMREWGEIANSLLVQQQDGTFRDVTAQAGVEVLAPTQAAAFADIDNDGDLDLYIGHERDHESALTDAYDGNLFRNRGDGTFDDITAAAGVANEGFCKGVAFGDYDGDRYPDLYLSNFKEANRLYRNNRDGTFTDVAAELGVQEPIKGFATWFFDYDNDGDLDLFATYYKPVESRKEMGAYYRSGTIVGDTCRLYENDGRGGFRDVTVERKLARVFFPMGASFGDVDNDGWQDLYLATGDPEYRSLWPNVMLRNDGGKRFQDVTASSGTGHLQKGHGVAFGDLDQDGDQDLMVQLGGALRDDAFWDAMFENPGHGNHWITVRPVGRSSNRFGVGTRIKVTIVEPEGRRDIYSFGGWQSSFGGNSLQQEIGLCRATRIESLEIWWPTTDRTQRFTDVPLDAVVRIDEGSEQLVVVSTAPAGP